MTGVQTIPRDQRRAIGELPPEIQQAIELRRARNLAAAQIAGLSWGEKIDENTRRAVASWGQQFRVDVTTEIHVLGGRVYLNAAFALRRLGEMIGEGLVEYAVADHIEDDPRLTKLGPEGEGEYSRRLRERIRYSVPENAKCAVAFRVKLRSMDEEVVGVKWTGTGKKNSYGKLADPVGEEFPVETAESRAARRAMRLLASHLPPAAKSQEDAIEASAEALSARIIQNRGEVKAQNQALEVKSTPLALPAQGDPYGEPAPISEPEPERTQDGRNGTRTEVGRACATPDSDAESNRGAAYRFVMPFGTSKGRPIGELPPEDLDKWYGHAKEQGEPDQKTRAFIAAVEELVNERDLERGE